MRHRDHVTSWALGVGLVAVFFASAPASALDLRSWDQQIDNGRSRFQVLRSFDNAAVLDKETQLIWERQPAAGFPDWTSARLNCANKVVGNRRGWRLPFFHELTSVWDPTQDEPALPVGHPFMGIADSSFYWSATTTATDSSVAWVVNSFGGSTTGSAKTNAHLVWCVRGGGPLDVY